MSWVREWTTMSHVMIHNKIPDPVQDPKLFAPTKVRVLKPSFCVAGKRVENGEEIEVPYHVARDLHAVGKCEFIDKV